MFIMETIPIIYIVLIAAAGFLSFKIFASVVKTAMSVVSLAFVLVVVSAVVVGLDAKDFAENFPEGPNLVLFVNDSELLAGASFSNSSFELLKGENVSEAASAVEKSDYGMVKRGHYKVIVVDYKILVFEGSGVEELAGGRVTRENFERSVSGLSERISGDPLFLVSEIKNGNLVFYEETPVFKAIKIAPPGLVRALSEGLAESLEHFFSEKIPEVETLKDAGKNQILEKIK